MSDFYTITIFLVLRVVYVFCQDTSLHDFSSINAALQYDQELLESEVMHKPHFIMFHAPWCGHCQRLSSTFDKLALKYNKELDRDQVVIAKVDCTKHTSLCSDNNVLGYPTLVFFWSTTSFSSKYKGSRDLESLDRYVQQSFASGPPPREVTATPPPRRKAQDNALFDLTDDTFSDHIATGQHFIEFYAPWCSHCKILAPTWQLLASKFEEDDEVTVAKVDCTKYNSICAKNAIRGYPTLIYFNRGLKMEQYNGVRDLNNLIEFVTMMKAKAATGPTVLVPPVDVKDDSKEEPDIDEVVVNSEDDKADDLDVDAHDKGEMVSLTEESFTQLVGGNQINFILFYVPWCPHCQALEPVWNELAERASGPDVTFSRVNCVEQNSLCGSNEIRGYPTIITFYKGHMINIYGGVRQTEQLVSYVDSMKDRFLKSSEDDLASKHPVVDLTLDSFSSVIGSHAYTFVLFTEQGCERCEGLKVIWEELGQSYLEEDWIRITKIDCSSEDKLCRLNGIEEYPTMILYHMEDRVGVYNGVAEVDQMRRFVDTSRMLRDEL